MDRPYGVAESMVIIPRHNRHVSVRHFPGKETSPSFCLSWPEKGEHAVIVMNSMQTKMGVETHCGMPAGEGRGP